MKINIITWESQLWWRVFMCFEIVIVMRCSWDCHYHKVLQPLNKHPCGLQSYYFRNYMNKFKSIKGNITQILKREVTKISIPQANYKNIWRTFHEWNNQEHFVKENFNTLWRKFSIAFRAKVSIAHRELKLEIWFLHFRLLCLSF